MWDDRLNLDFIIFIIIIISGILVFIIDNLVLWLGDEGSLVVLRPFFWFS